MALPQSLSPAGCSACSSLAAFFRVPSFLLAVHHRELGLEGVRSPSQKWVLDLSERTGVPPISRRPNDGSPAPCPSLPLCHL